MNNFKKFTAIILSMIMVFGFLPIIPNNLTQVQADAGNTDISSGTCGDGLNWTLDDEGKLTISGMGAMNNYTNSAGCPWDKEKVKSVEIQSGVTSIGDYAFAWCTGLTSILIPDSVTSIGEMSVYGCKSLTSIVIPDNVTMIEENAFAWCTGLISATLPKSATSIGKYAFNNCSMLENVIIPDGITTIEDGLFYNCSSLTSITIPSSVATVKGDAFYNCNGLGDIYFYGTEEQWNGISNNILNSFSAKPIVHIMIVASGTCGNNVNWTLDDEDKLTISGTGTTADYSWTSDLPWDSSKVKTVEIQEGVTSIGAYAFKECTVLTSIKIPGTVTLIGDGAFECCSGLTGITIPDSVTTIGEAAFNCSGLTSVTIPNSVTTIKALAFSWCNISSITIPKGVTSIERGVFNHCNSLTNVTIPDSVTVIADAAFDWCESLTSITIPESVTSVGESAFLGCTSLESITIPGSVTSIGEDVFKYCENLTDIYFYGSQSQWDTMSSNALGSLETSPTVHIIVASGSCGDNLNWTLDSYGKLIISGIGSMTSHPWDVELVKSVELQDGMTSIDSSAFANCTGLESITIPDSVTTVGDYAFKSCRNLTSITISCKLKDSIKSNWFEGTYVENPTLKHSYGKITYTWADDNTKCTAERLCTICGDSDSETVDTEATVTQEKTSTQPELTKYTATFKNTSDNGFETQIKENIKTADPEYQQTDKKPTIGDKTGWDEIKADITEQVKNATSTSEKITITIDMNTTSKIDGGVIDAIKGKNVDVVLDMGNGIAWTINGKSVTSDNVADIDLGVDKNTNAIPVDVMNTITGQKSSIQISLVHNGEFGFTATLSIGLDSDNAGYYANLFYYNTETGSLEFMNACKIDAQGNASLTFTHASDYTIVIADKVMDGSDSSKTSESDTSTNVSTASVKTGDNRSMLVWIMLMIGVMIELAGVSRLGRKSRGQK